MRSTPPLAVDLFSGCGGLSLGLVHAGFSVAAAIELNPIAADTYRQNHPRTNVHVGDIREIDIPKLRKSLPKRGLTLLTGCAPCQGFCSLTAKCRREDPRNDLVLEIGRYVQELRPDAVFMENVPGLAGRGKHLLNGLLRQLRCAGYYCQVRTVQMANYGVPQHRRRLVLLGGRGFMIPFPEPTHHRLGQEKGMRRWVSLREVIHGWRAPVRLSRSWSNGGPRAVNWHVVRDIQERTHRRLKAAIPGETWVGVDQELRPTCHQGSYVGFTNVYGRMAWDDIAVTMTAGCTTPCKGRFGHPDRRRTTISVREAATIQTFPRSYRFMTDQMDAVCDMIGNAVPPSFARIIGAQIIKTVREHHETLAGKRTQ